jgi:hypothetical protein
MSASFLELFRLLSSFSPPRRTLPDAPWEAYADWAIAQGLGPLASYNLEYRLGGAGAPDFIRERLLSVYQGLVNDNVMKLVNFKRAVTELEGRKIILIGAAAFADSLYPHVAFRPVGELQMLVRPSDLDGFSGYLAKSQFKPAPALAERTGATRVLTDNRTPLLLYTHFLGPGLEREEALLFERAVLVRAYGPSIYRLELEDALLLQCLEQAQLGYDVPMLSFLDLRELLLGAPSVSGPYSRAVRPEVVRERAAALGIERALYTSLSIAERLFPETAGVAEGLKPTLKRVTRELLDRLVVSPLGGLQHPGRTRGTERLWRLLAGGRQRLRTLESQT